MATDLFLLDDAPSGTVSNTAAWVVKKGIGVGTRGGAAVTITNNTTAGSSGRCTDAGNTNFIEWFTPPLEAVSLAAQTITINFWGHESGTMANKGHGVEILRCNGDNSSRSNILTILNGADTVEFGTTIAARQWTESTSAATINAGDRIIIRAYQVSIGTGATGFTSDFAYGGPTGGALGDAWVRFAETIVAQSVVTAPPKPHRVNSQAVRRSSLIQRDDGLYVPDRRIWVPNPSFA